MRHRRRRRWHCCGASWRSAACCRRCPTTPSTWAHGSRESLSAHARHAAAAAPAACPRTPRPRRQSCSSEAFWSSIGTRKMGAPRVHVACWHACMSARGPAQAACLRAHCREILWHAAALLPQSSRGGCCFLRDILGVVDQSGMGCSW